MRVILRLSVPASPLVKWAREALSLPFRGVPGVEDQTRWRAVHVSAAVLSDVGCERQSNEDRGSVVTPKDTGLRERKGTLAIVADGMGGHFAGEVASSIAVDVIPRVYFQSPSEPQAALIEAYRSANAEIQRASQEHKGRRMGTTGTTVVLIGGKAIWAHVGDCRLYLVRKRKIRQLTEDHSEIMQLLKKREITAAEARQHPGKNVILRALGVEPEVEVDFQQTPLEILPGDKLILCSDGLHGQVEDKEIQKAVRNSEPEQACQKLIDRAKRRGGPDNITVAILAVNWER